MQRHILFATTGLAIMLAGPALSQDYDPTVTIQPTMDENQLPPELAGTWPQPLNQPPLFSADIPVLEPDTTVEAETDESQLPENLAEADTATMDVDPMATASVGPAIEQDTQFETVQAPLVGGTDVPSPRPDLTVEAKIDQNQLPANLEPGRTFVESGMPEAAPGPYRILPQS